MILFINSSKRREVQTWINNEHGKSFKIKHKTDYEKSAMEIKQKGKDCEMNVAEKNEQRMQQTKGS